MFYGKCHYRNHAFSLKISSSKSFGIKGKISDAVKKMQKDCVKPFMVIKEGFVW